MMSLGINRADWNSSIILQGLDPVTLGRWPSTKLRWIRLSSSEHTGISVSGGNALE